MGTCSDREPLSGGLCTALRKSPPFRGGLGVGAGATTMELPACLAAAGSWRRGRGRGCCWRCGRWRLWPGAAPGKRAMEGGERRRRAGGGSGRAVKWAADPLCPQAAARARGAGGPGGGTALRGGASGRPQLLRVRAAVRVPPRTGHPSHTPLTVPQSAAVTPSFADPSARVPQDSPL